MSFTERFAVRPTRSPPGFSFTGLTVCEGDSISSETQGFEIVARIVRDDCGDAPEFRGSENAPVERFPAGRQDGFWPSEYIGDPGFMGEADQESIREIDSPPNGNNWRQQRADAQAKAEAIMEAWRNDEWFYCGIVLSVSLDGVMLDRNAASLWGVEANYPGTDNAYLNDVADELLSEAIEAGREIAERLRLSLHEISARG